MKKRFIVIFLAVVCILSVQSYAVAVDNDVVAKIKGRDITEADLNRMIISSGRQPKDIPQQHKEAFLRQTLQVMAVSALAKEEGYDKKPDIIGLLEMTIDNALATSYIAKKADDSTMFSEEDLKLYHKTRSEEFKLPEMVKARHIMIKVSKTAADDLRKAAKVKAEEILKRLKAGEDFAKLANEFSEDTGSKGKGGDLGFFAKGRMVPEFEKAAFSLKPGDLSEIVETKFGYHIIKVEEKKAEEYQPYEKVKDAVKKKAFDEMKQAKAKEIVEKAMKAAQIEVYTEKLKAKEKPEAEIKQK